MELLLLGEKLRLLPERAIYWERTASLLVADTHWGKAATMRSAGIPIPAGTTSADLDRLTSLLQTTAARRLVLLGDAIHARAGRTARTLGAVETWRRHHAELDILLVRGNHDRSAGDPPAQLNIRCVEAPQLEPPFVFQHFPAASGHGYALAGHTHPAYKICGIAGERATVACFHFTKTHATLPAFGTLTGCALIRPETGDAVYGIAGDEVIRVY